MPEKEGGPVGALRSCQPSQSGAAPPWLLPAWLPPSPLYHLLPKVLGPVLRQLGGAPGPGAGEFEELGHDEHRRGQSG
ncbi:unnamed protein product [Gulo gulo]|uniref:Uncharacterized protein n=1 Tax=Gulo gulo TaxID=48420 RepID=A0A9X9LYT9_GULGU|nr:unnamed protein product [Gulo gulo]